MPGAPHKRQKREEYRKFQIAATATANTNGGTPHQIAMPKKKFYRQRAHANPFSDHALMYPPSPSQMDWSTYFPAFKVSTTTTTSTTTEPGDGDPQDIRPTKISKQVEIADIGCGFGGLIVALSPLYPDTLMIGMELRMQVTDFVVNRVAALRSQNPGTPTTTQQPSTETGPSQSQPEISSTTTSTTPSQQHPPYTNISALRTNTMKFLPNYFPPSSLRSIFLCFPDPHFKQRKHKARIVSPQLAAEYAYVLRPGGKVYTITDVEELHGWMVKHFVGVEAGDGKVLWERVGEEEVEGDEMVGVMREGTEEGRKVSRNGGNKFVAVFRRVEDPGWVDEEET